jgi:flagellar basal body rod protein FlgG
VKADENSSYWATDGHRRRRNHGRAGVVNFINPDTLARVGGGCTRPAAKRGDRRAGGDRRSGSLESSNVDKATEMTELIKYSGCSSSIQNRQNHRRDAG